MCENKIELMEKETQLTGWLEKMYSINKLLQDTTEILNHIVTIPTTSSSTSPNPKNPNLADTLSIQILNLEKQSIYLITLAETISKKF